MKPKDPLQALDAFFRWEKRIRNMRPCRMETVETLFLVEDKFFSRWMVDRLPTHLEAWLHVVFRHYLLKVRKRRRLFFSLDDRLERREEFCEGLPVSSELCSTRKEPWPICSETKDFSDPQDTPGRMVLALFLKAIQNGELLPKLGSKPIRFTSTQRLVLEAFLGSGSLKEAARKVALSPRDFRNYLKGIVKKIAKNLPPPLLIGRQFGLPCIGRIGSKTFSPIPLFSDSEGTKDEE